MWRVLVEAWSNAAGLLVEDGWIALGTIAALAATGLWAAFMAGSDELRDLG